MRLKAGRANWVRTSPSRSSGATRNSPLRMQVAAQRQIQQADDAGMDRGGVLDLEGAGDPGFTPLQPQDVDQPDGIGAGACPMAGGRFSRQPSPKRPEP